MKQREDTKTGDMLRSTGAKAQAAYAERMRAQGLKQRTFWLTDEEAAKVRRYIERSRFCGTGGPGEGAEM